MVKTISHREMRNNSAAILKAVEAGESFEITNHGKLVAVLSPVGDDPYRGQNVTRATGNRDWESLRPVKIDQSVQSILDDLREDRF